MLFVNLISGAILSSYDVVETVIATERKNSKLSVRQFKQLASHQDLSKSKLEVHFEPTKTDGVRGIRIVPSAGAESLLGSLDADHSGSISEQELATQCGKELAAEVFKKHDLDGNGELSLEELQHIMV